MRHVPILVLTFVFGLPAAAQAEMLPTYDPMTICETIAGSSTRQELIMRGCLDFQERIRKQVALEWDTVPEPVRQSCAAAAKESGDYWKLKSCLDLSVSASAGSEAGR